MRAADFHITAADKMCFSCRVAFVPLVTSAKPGSAARVVSPLCVPLVPSRADSSECESDKHAKCEPLVQVTIASGAVQWSRVLVSRSSKCRCRFRCKFLAS